MINKHNFYEFSKGNKKRYFCISEELDRECFLCKKLISEPVAVYYYNIFQKYSEFGICHLKCKDKISIKANYQEIGLFTFSIDRLPGAIPIIFGYKAVRAANNNLTVFEAAELPADRIKDKTIYANRETLESSNIGLISDERAKNLDFEIINKEKLYFEQLEQTNKEKEVLNNEN